METVEELAEEMDLRELVTIALLAAAQDTLLPEIAEIVGTDAVIGFLDVFGGCLIKVPDRTVIAYAARDAAVYRRAREGEGAEDLAIEFDIGVDEVEEIHERMGGIVAVAAPYLAKTFAKKKRR